MTEVERDTGWMVATFSPLILGINQRSASVTWTRYAI